MFDSEYTRSKQGYETTYDEQGTHTYREVRREAKTPSLLSFPLPFDLELIHSVTLRGNALERISRHNIALRFYIRQGILIANILEI